MDLFLFILFIYLLIYLLQSVLLKLLLRQGVKSNVAGSLRVGRKDSMLFKYLLVLRERSG